MLAFAAVVRADAAGSSPSPASQPATFPSAASQPAVDFTADLTGDWFGVRKTLANQGFTAALTLTSDGTKGLEGGLNTRSSRWRTLTDVSFNFDPQPLFHIEHGMFYVDFQNTQGPSADDRLVGDVQGIDTIDAFPGQSHEFRDQLSQIWYQQIAFSGLLRVKLGKLDASTEFDSSPTAQQFLNRSGGSSPTLFTLPTFPDPATSANLFINPTSDIQIGLGIYDGSFAGGTRTGSLGPARFLDRDDNLLLISELDKSWTLALPGLPGRVGVGGWFSTNRLPRLNGSTADGTGAPYALVDQALWRTNPGNPSDKTGLDVFGMYGYADPAILSYDEHLGAGITWTGPSAARPNDLIGLAFQAVHFSPAFHPTTPYEVNYEIFYQAQITPWFVIKPDLQYITGPGGQGAPDALALTLRLQLTL